MTKRDRDILNYIKEYMIENGTTPTVREIGEGVCLYSTNAVYSHMQNLIECGEIIQTKEKRYGYKVKGMKYVREDT